MANRRNLSPAEYFLEIQKEYLIAEFRSKIYPNPRDKKYYQRVMRYKADKIRDISARNNLYSILNNETMKNEVVRSFVFDVSGKPIFKMTDDDIENYYAVGCEVSYRGEIWILDSINVDGTVNLFSPIREVYEKVSRSEICRIL